ncbi:MAG: TetR/AcrR family transcriptional regulator [Bradyrhizobium sp.]|nr:TetR/AcrR family transcriptional regulator [Bradyrhizobium sp.]
MPPKHGRATTSPRKTPIQERSKATVDVIAEAAARILAKEGAEALTTNRIAEVAGVSVGSVYQYFPNKEAIVAALLETRLMHSRSLIEALPIADGTSLADLIRERVAILTRIAFDDVFFPMELAAFIRSGSAPKTLVEKPVTEQFRLILEARRTELVVEDLELSAAFCTAAVRGVLMATREKTIAASPEKIISELTNLLLRYLSECSP